MNAHIPILSALSKRALRELSLGIIFDRMNTPDQILWPLALLLFALGTCLGSFFNVVIGRWPLGISVVSPPSRCPQCGHGIRPYHNIPILGWLILGGKCKDCKNPISAEYPIVEFTTGLLGALPLLCWPWSGLDLEATLELSLLAICAVPIILIDLRHFLIPDLVVWPAAFFAWALSFIPGSMGWDESLLAALGAGGFLYLFAKLMSKLLGKEAMGMGDVQLMVLLGAALGVQVLWVLPLAAVLGLLGTLLMPLLPAVFRPKSADPEIPAGSIPFGPYLCLAALIAGSFGRVMSQAYLDLLGP